MGLFRYAATSCVQIAVSDEERLATLSEQQRYIFDQVALGVHNKDIAHNLGCVLGSVYKQRLRIYQKLGISRDREIVVFAARLGLIGLSEGRKEVIRSQGGEA